MKRFSKTAGIMAVFFFLSILMSTTGHVLAQGHFGGHDGKGFLSTLTDEQREVIQEKREEMRNQGATREEIHAVMAEMLKGYGVELPENWGEQGGGDHRDFLNNLSDEQREIVRDKVDEMREQGATRKEIHNAITKLLEGYGIEMPEFRQGSPGFDHKWHGFGDKLTDEQRRSIEEKIQKIREQGANRDEIHTTIAEMIKGYGIEVPDDWDGPPPLGDPWGDFCVDLTEEQRNAVREKIQEMRNRSAPPQEIHTKITEMLKEYGVELPEKSHGWHHPGGFGPLGNYLGAELTEEQRKVIRKKIGEMRGQGATREEIRTQVDQILKGYGVMLPDFFSKLTDEQRRIVRNKIREMKRQGTGCEDIRAAVARMVQDYGYDLPEISKFNSSETASGESHIKAESYPNPFNPETQIFYTLSSSEEVQIQIYNVTGQLIRTYDIGYQPAGSYSVTWNGRNDSGDMTASGVYLYRIEAGPHEVTNRMVLLK